jgi:putative hydrolase of the HAD superfamily
MPSVYPANAAGRSTSAPAASATCDASRPSLAAQSAVDGCIFDTADVLYDATPWRRWLARLMSHLGVTVDTSALLATWDREYLPDVCRGRREHSEALSSFLLAAGLSWAQVDEVEAASRVERRKAELNVRPFSGVVKTIQQLSQWKVPMVAWADSPYSAARVSERLDRLGLGGPFRAVLCSFDLEAAQPAARCYQAALEALGTTPGATIYVSHDAAHLSGAKALGLRTAAFNYQPGAAADHYLARFEDVLTLVDRASHTPQVGAGPTAAGCSPSAEGSR